ncbi:MAG: hypothetical protein NTW56_19530 [Alphaproteobacteria bacterium]|nr:hypothetical protein [Alphaproteobacteria bacterium]
MRQGHLEIGIGEERLFLPAGLHAAIIQHGFLRDIGTAAGDEFAQGGGSGGGACPETINEIDDRQFPHSTQFCRNIRDF